MVAATATRSALLSSSLWHCPTDLTFVDACDKTNIVHFSASSKSRPGDANVIGLDILTGATLCNCKAAETHRHCWHAELVQAAWDGHPARVLAARYTDDQLEAAGKKALRTIRAYRARRYWNVLPGDQLMLLACRSEYRRRYRLTPLVAVDVADAAPDTAAA